MFVVVCITTLLGVYVAQNNKIASDHKVGFFAVVGIFCALSILIDML